MTTMSKEEFKENMRQAKAKEEAAETPNKTKRKSKTIPEAQKETYTEEQRTEALRALAALADEKVYEMQRIAAKHRDMASIYQTYSDIVREMTQ